MGPGATLSSYPYQMTVPSRFTDIDVSGAIGHVGLARYHEDARAAFLHDLIGAHASPSHKWRALLARIRTEVLMPARYPGSISLGVGVLAVRERTYALEVGTFQNGQLLARARSLSVAVDASHQPLQITDEVRRIMLSMSLPAREWSFDTKPDKLQLTLESYPSRLELPTRFSDTDALGHLNNVGVLRYCEEARVAFFGSSPQGAGTVTQVDISYLRESRFREQMIIGTRMQAEDHGEARCAQGLFQRQQCVATCEFRIRLPARAPSHSEIADTTP